MKISIKKIKVFFISIISFFILITSKSYAADKEEIISEKKIEDFIIRTAEFKKKITKFDVKKIKLPLKINTEYKKIFDLNNKLSIIGNIKNETICNIEKYEEENLMASKLKIGNLELCHKTLGSISYGKNYAPMRDVLRVGHIKSFFVNENNKFNYFMMNKTKNLLSYKNDNLFGLLNNFEFKIHYQMENPIICTNYNKKFIKYANKKGYGFNFNNKVNKNLNILGGFFRSGRVLEQISFDPKKEKNNSIASSYGIGYKYNNDNIHLSFLFSIHNHIFPYGNVNNSYIRTICERDSLLSKSCYCGFLKKVYNFETVYKYNLNSGLSSSIGYFLTMVKNLKGKNKFMNNFLGLGIGLPINENIKLNINYKFNFIKDDLFTKISEIDSHNTFLLILEYNI